MAIDLRYQKVNETATTVTYRFGSPHHMDQEVVINKTDSGDRVVSGPNNQLTVIVVGRALSRFEETGAWPGGGGYQA
ncbi:hypothetical protein [Nocardia sp. NPDC050406]|uniref:hypothetical protein n=1 Tax=Nocardia sp. NPDC050406 TaxID=3364318 RepID=UPI00379E4E51